MTRDSILREVVHLPMELRYIVVDYIGVAEVISVEEVARCVRCIVIPWVIDWWTADEYGGILLHWGLGLVGAAQRLEVCVSDCESCDSDGRVFESIERLLRSLRCVVFFLGEVRRCLSFDCEFRVSEIDHLVVSLRRCWE